MAGSRKYPFMRYLAGTFGRVVLLIALIVGSGVAAGLALGLPLRFLGGDSNEVRIDHQALVGKVTAEKGFVELDDLPPGWQASTETIDSLTVLNKVWCENKVSTDRLNKVGPLRIFEDPQTQSIIVSEVFQTNVWEQADSYVSAIGESFDCRKSEQTEGDRTVVYQKEGLLTAPTSSFVGYRINIPTDQKTMNVAYLYVANVVVVVQYFGTDAPSYFDDITRSILSRLDPDDFPPVTASQEVTTDQTVVDGTETTTNTPDAGEDVSTDVSEDGEVVEETTETTTG